MESQTDTELFEQGKSYYEKKDYKKALQYFLYVKENFLRSSYAGVTRFYAGECYFARKDYEDAAIEYQSFLAFFPNDPNAPVAQYKLGVSHFEQSRGPDREQTKIQQALSELQKVRENYPNAEVQIKKAEEQLEKVKHELARHELYVATIYRKDKLYTSSNLRLDYLLKEYPGTELAGDALFYQGLNYLDLKQPEKAKASLLRFIREYPRHRHLSSAQKKLAKLGVTTIPEPESPTTTRTESSAILSQKESPKTPDLKPSSIEGYVVTIRDKQIFTNLVRDDGIKEGMVLDVFRNNTRIGTIQIIEIQAGFSVGKPETLVSGRTIQENDTICCPKVE